jgi:hypothetical protein
MPDSFVKDPDEVLDYVRDWSAVLVGGDTIATSTWTPETGITVNSSSHDDTTATVWISGGTLGADYGVLNRITTTAGRTLDHTLRFLIRAK